MDTVWLLRMGKLIRSTLFVYWSASLNPKDYCVHKLQDLIWYVNLRICSVVSVNLGVCGMNWENIRILCTPVLCYKCKKFYIDITYELYMDESS